MARASKTNTHPAAAIAIANEVPICWSAAVADRTPMNGINGVEVAVLVAVLVRVDVAEVVAVVVGVVVGDVELVDGIGIVHPVCLPVHTSPFNWMIAMQHWCIPPSIAKQSPPPH